MPQNVIQANVDLLAPAEAGNGIQVQGAFANELVSAGTFNAHSMRPFIGADGRPYVNVYKGSGDKRDIKNYIVQPATYATLRRDEWKQLDEAILEVSRQRLTGVDDLVSKGLTYNLGNAMGTTVLEWHDVGEAMEADLTMDGVTRGIGDRIVYQHNYLPIPIIHVDYEINARVLEASRRLGNPLDTTSAERATRKVREKLEDMLFTNTTYTFGATDSRSRNTIYSYVNHPDRNTVSLTVAWDASSTTPARILADVLAMKKASIAAYHYGNWMLYIPTDYETVLDQDYDTTTPGTTIRDRIMKIGGIDGIKVVDRLATDNVLLVQMTSDVVRLVRGMDIQSVEWQTEGKFITKYKIWTIQVPQIRSDQNGRCGIVHMS